MTELRGESGLKITLDERAPEILVVGIVGDLGIFESQDLEKSLLRITTRKGLIVFDLSAVGLVSSLAMGVFVAAQRGAKIHHATLRLAAMQPRVNESFQRARLDKVFSIHPTVDDALRA